MHPLDDFSVSEQACGGATVGVDVRAKLILGLAGILAVVMSTRVALPLVVLAGCAAWLVATRAPLGVALHRLAGPLGLAIVVGLARTFLTGTTPLASFDLGPLHLVATREGLVEGTQLACRVLGSLAVILVLCRSTSAEQMFAALRWARMPQAWLEIAMLMYRYIFVFFEQAASVVSAQKVRLGYGGLRASIRSLGSLAGVVILRSFDQAEKTYEAMLARGFHGNWPVPRLAPMPGRQAWLTGIGVGLVAMVYLLTERWP